MFFSVFKILLSNLFNLKFFEAKDGKKGKTIAKTVAIAFLMIYGFACYGFLYTVTMVSVYKNLEITGTTSLMPLISLLMSSMFIVVFGFMTAASNYYTGNGEEQFLAMPLKPADIFGAKIGVCIVSDSLVGVFVNFIGSVIYGYYEKLLIHPSFWIGVIVSTITIVVFVIAIIYFLLIVILKLFPAMRKKNILVGIASFFVIIFAIFYSLVTSKVGSGSIADSQTVQTIQPLVEAVTGFAQKIDFAKWIAGAITGNWLAILFMLVILALVIFVFVPLMAPLYIKTLNGFSDVKSKKLTKEQSSQLLKKEIKKDSISKALFIRDVKTVLREPVFFSNGPLVIFIFPAILLVSFVVGLVSSGESVNLMKQDINNLFFNADVEGLTTIKYSIVLIGSLFSAFVGSMSSIGATCFSREGKALYDLKAMPIENDDIVFAKFWHAFMYAQLAYVMIGIYLLIVMLFFKINLSAVEVLSIYLQIFCIHTVLSLILIFVEMFLDTINPKLEWENPIAAIKQNGNILISALITFGIIAIFAVLGFAVLPKSIIGVIIMVVLGSVISAPLGSIYWKYAVKKINNM